MFNDEKYQIKPLEFALANIDLIDKLLIYDGRNNMVPRPLLF